MIQRYSSGAPGRSRTWRKVLLTLAKSLGLFSLSRALTKNQLRILCYHGFGTSDAVSFRPLLFIREETFRERLEILKRGRFPVISLEEAVDGLSQKKLPPGAVVITVDDGFDDTHTIAAPALKEYGFPATIYVTTYYQQKQQIIFRLAVQYMFWKTSIDHLVLPSLFGLPPGHHDISSSEKKQFLETNLIAAGERVNGEHLRQQALDVLAAASQVDLAALRRSRFLTIMNDCQIHDLLAQGIDIQLHTHRHRLPLEREGTVLEIQENRSVLEPLVGKRLSHFCYPSGIWSDKHWPGLVESGVQSATTCDAGLNSHRNAPLALKRFLDSEDIETVEFEAEIYGFAEIVRRFKRWLGVQRQADHLPPRQAT